jgi:DNA-directed RNA polymerase specialized sigma24 family protein
VAARRAARQAARRREALVLLRIAECTCRYGASQLANGASPDEARDTALFVAGELAGMAEALRRAVRPSRAERQGQAVELVTLEGLSARQAAARLGVTERTIWRDLGHP